MPVLAYWDIRGLAQPIRLLLTYVGEEFEDKRYKIGPAPDFNRDCWYNEKFTLGLDFSNLPYYKDDEVKITQSNAIMRHIARKHKLCGGTDKVKAEADMCADQIMDLRNGFVILCYSNKSDYEEKRPGYIKDLPGKLDLFEKYLGDKKWLVGDHITYPDFHLYEMLDQHKIFEPGCLNNFPKLSAYCERFEALPAIKQYLSSENFQASPINNASASWVG